MVIYCFTLFISTLLMWLSNLRLSNDKNIWKNKSYRFYENIIQYILYFLSFLIVFFVSAFRVNVGTDYNNYIIMYKQININGFNNKIEIGYQYLNKILGYFSFNPQIIIIVSSLTTLSLIFYAIKNYSKNKSLSLFLFISMTYYFGSMNLVRQFMAIGIGLTAFKFVKKNQFFNYLIFILLAMLFHRTAIIFLPIYFLYHFKSIHNYYLGVILFIPVLSLISKPLLNRFLIIFSNLYDIYESSIGNNIISFNRILFEIGLFLIAYLLFNKYIRNRSNDYLMYIGLLNIQLLHIFIMFSSRYLPYANRFLDYTGIFQILLIPLIISKIKEGYLRKIAIFFTISYFTLYMIRSVLLLNSNEVLPYQSIFNLNLI